MASFPSAANGSGHPEFAGDSFLPEAPVAELATSNPALERTASETVQEASRSGLSAPLRWLVRKVVPNSELGSKLVAEKNARVAALKASRAALRIDAAENYLEAQAKVLKTKAEANYARLRPLAEEAQQKADLATQAGLRWRQERTGEMMARATETKLPLRERLKNVIERIPLRVKQDARSGLRIRPDYLMQKHAADADRLALQLHEAGKVAAGAGVSIPDKEARAVAAWEQVKSLGEELGIADQIREPSGKPSAKTAKRTIRVSQAEWQHLQSLAEREVDESTFGLTKFTFPETLGEAGSKGIIHKAGNGPFAKGAINLAKGVDWVARKLSGRPPRSDKVFAIVTALPSGGADITMPLNARETPEEALFSRMLNSARKHATMMLEREIKPSLLGSDIEKALVAAEKEGQPERQYRAMYGEAHDLVAKNRQRIREEKAAPEIAEVYDRAHVMNISRDCFVQDWQDGHRENALFDERKVAEAALKKANIRAQRVKSVKKTLQLVPVTLHQVSETAAGNLSALTERVLPKVRAPLSLVKPEAALEAARFFKFPTFEMPKIQISGRRMAAGALATAMAGTLPFFGMFMKKATRPLEEAASREMGALSERAAAGGRTAGEFVPGAAHMRMPGPGESAPVVRLASLPPVSKIISNPPPREPLPVTTETLTTLLPEKSLPAIPTVRFARNLTPPKVSEIAPEADRAVQPAVMINDSLASTPAFTSVSADGPESQPLAIPLVMNDAPLAGTEGIALVPSAPATAPAQIPEFLSATPDMVPAAPLPSLQPEKPAAGSQFMDSSQPGNGSQSVQQRILKAGPAALSAAAIATTAAPAAGNASMNDTDAPNDKMAMSNATTQGVVTKHARHSHMNILAKLHNVFSRPDPGI